MDTDTPTTLPFPPATATAPWRRRKRPSTTSRRRVDALEVWSISLKDNAPVYGDQEEVAWGIGGKGSD